MKNILTLLVCVFISACTINAPRYQPSVDNSNILQDITSKKLSVARFKDSKPEVNDLSMRGSTLESPYDKSFSLYLSTALEEELKLAGIWGNNSKIQISGVLIDNQLDVSGFSIGTASITVKFMVKRNGKLVYANEVSAHHEWESSFIGGIAIPAGTNNYPIVIQKLFTNLFKDRNFIKAVT